MSSNKLVNLVHKFEMFGIRVVLERGPNDGSFSILHWGKWIRIPNWLSVHRFMCYPVVRYQKSSQSNLWVFFLLCDGILTIMLGVQPVSDTVSRLLFRRLTSTSGVTQIEWDGVSSCLASVDKTRCAPLDDPRESSNTNGTSSSKATTTEGLEKGYSWNLLKYWLQPSEQLSDVNDRVRWRT